MAHERAQWGIAINSAHFLSSRRNKLIADKMGKNCVTAGCKSTCRDTVSFLKFPSDNCCREQWIRQVMRICDCWNGLSKHSFFSEDCFQSVSAISPTMRISWRKSLSGHYFHCFRASRTDEYIKCSTNFSRKRITIKASNSTSVTNSQLK